MQSERTRTVLKVKNVCEQGTSIGALNQTMCEIEGKQKK